MMKTDALTKQVEKMVRTFAREIVAFADARVQARTVKPRLSKKVAPKVAKATMVGTYDDARAVFDGRVLAHIQANPDQRTEMIFSDLRLKERDREPLKASLQRLRAGRCIRSRGEKRGTTWYAKS